MTDEARRERVARAIETRIHEIGWEATAYLNMADAAIAAMPEPQPVDLVEEVAELLANADGEPLRAWPADSGGYRPRSREIIALINDRLRDGAEERLAELEDDNPGAFNFELLRFFHIVDAVLSPLAEALEDK